MSAVQYFANLRTLNKMTLNIREIEIQILELEKTPLPDPELHCLHLTQKRTQKAIEEYHKKKLEEMTDKLLPKSVGVGDGGGLKPDH